jgi:L-lactate dehydrogenase complex protein LldG
MKARERILSDIRNYLSIRGDIINQRPQEMQNLKVGRKPLHVPLDGFIKLCEQTQAKIHSMTDITQATHFFHSLLREKKVRHVVLWDHPLTQLIMEAVQGSEKIEWLVWNPSKFEDQRTNDQGKTRLSEIDLGLTAVDFALADTGSLVLMAAEGHDPLISLLPPIHVALLKEDQILESIDVLLDRIRDSGYFQSRTFYLISGPSRTGDIELTMSLGVHGPKEVHIILLPGDTNGRFI